MDDEHVHEERTAAQTIDEMRDGARAMVVIALDRLRESQDALQAGDFARASTRLSEASAKVNALFNAEQNIAAFAGKTALRARDIEKGMEIVGEGVVTVVENITEHGDECPEAMFQFTLQDGDMRRAYADQEILVARSAE